MLLTTYQQCAWNTDRTREDHRGLHMAIGFLDESSHVCGLVKAARREQVGVANVILHHPTLVEEIGDSLWYLGAIHSVRDQTLGFRLPVTCFEEIDQQAQTLPQMDATAQLLSSTINLAHHLDHDKNFPHTHVGRHLQALANFAHTFGTSLSESATYNLNKINGRYIIPNQFQWPETSLAELGTMSVEFRQNSSQVVMMVNDRSLGDPLDSQASIDDGFKWHDSLHLAFATHLGWSPVIRKLTGTKRDADELDGARYQQMEEVIIQRIWSRNQDHRPVDWDLLNQIKADTKDHPEARHISYMQWERAIRNGLDVSEQLMAHGHGRIDCDFRQHSMVFSA